MASALRCGRNLLSQFRMNASCRLLSSHSNPGDANFENDPAYASGKTSVTILNKEQDGGLFIDAYSCLGFRLNSGIRVMGPCAIFPRSVLHWNVTGVNDINEDSLTLFTVLEPKLDLLVLGVGERENLSRVKPEVLNHLRTKKINVEILATDQALATFNFLNSEKRYVAGAFIPPSYVEDYDPDETGYDVMSQHKDPYLVERDYHEIPEGPGELDVPESDKNVKTSIKDKVYRKKEREEDREKNPDKYLD